MVRFAISILCSTLMVWFMVSFVQWSIDPGEWSLFARISATAICLLVWYAIAVQFTNGGEDTGGKK